MLIIKSSGDNVQRCFLLITIRKFHQTAVKVVGPEVSWSWLFNTREQAGRFRNRSGTTFAHPRACPQYNNAIDSGVIGEAVIGTPLPRVLFDMGESDFGWSYLCPPVGYGVCGS